MNVIQETEDGESLLVWANAEIEFLGEATTYYCLKAVVESGRLSQILSHIDEFYFGEIGVKADSVEEIFSMLEEFINK